MLEFVIGSRKSFVDRAEDVDLTLAPAVDMMSEPAFAATHFPRPASTRTRNPVEGLAVADNQSGLLDTVAAMLLLVDGPGPSSTVNYKCNYLYSGLSRGGIRSGRLRRRIVTVGHTVDHSCSGTQKMEVQVVECTQSGAHRTTERAQRGSLMVYWSIGDSEGNSKRGEGEQLLKARIQLVDIVESV